MLAEPAAVSHGAASKIHESPLGALQGAQILCAVQKLYILLGALQGAQKDICLIEALVNLPTSTNT